MKSTALAALISLGMMAPAMGWAKGSAQSPDAMVGSKVQKPLSIKGQANRLSMMTVLQNQQDDVNFVKIKQNFKSEILQTNF